MIPSVISPSTRSKGERKMFDRLEAVKLPDWTCMHSLRLSKHDYKQSGEIDFVLFGPPGVLLLEVKGGRVKRDDNGMWTFINERDEEFRTSEGPDQQAVSARFSLEKDLNRHRKGPLITFGWAMVFPDIEFNEPSVEWAEEQVFDINKVASSLKLKQSILASMDYAIKRARRKNISLYKADRLALEQLLRPKFDRAQSLMVKAREMEIITEAMTDEQYRAFEGCLSNDRIICTGGAGTGKTFIALETAKRLAEKGDQVTFLCSSAVLSRWLQEQDTTGSINFLSVEEIEPLGQEIADVVVVDEAQDFMDVDGISTIASLCGSDFENGRWRIFMDPNAQAKVTGRFDQEVYDYVQLLGVRFELLRNCRNTSQIVENTQLFTGADIGIPTAGSGPEPLSEAYADRAQAGRLLGRFISRILSKGALVSDITILSHLPFKDSTASLLSDSTRKLIKVLTKENASDFPFDAICFADPVTFKGLENDIVVLIDIETIEDSDRWMGEFYVALTRPRRMLWKLMHQDCGPDLDSLMDNNRELEHS